MYFLPSTSSIVGCLPVDLHEGCATHHCHLRQSKSLQRASASLPQTLKEALSGSAGEATERLSDAQAWLKIESGSRT